MVRRGNKDDGVVGWGGKRSRMWTGVWPWEDEACQACRILGGGDGWGTREVCEAGRIDCGRNTMW